MPRYIGEALYAHMRQDRSKEQMAFGLANAARTAGGTVLLLHQLILPDQNDLSVQTSGSVCPKKAFQDYVYFLALQFQSVIVEFHTHPGTAVPRFSGTDDRYAHQNAEDLCRVLKDPITLALVVGNDRFDAFDGVVYDRHARCFQQVHRLEVLGRPSEIRWMGEASAESPAAADAAFDRQLRIPGWNQRGLERQRVGIIGVGGNGAATLATLVGIGAGRQGFIVCCDHDAVEASNLPRIPYATEAHVGTPKVSVAVQYVGTRSPRTPVYAFPCRFEERVVQERMKMATVLFYCGDDDGGRKAANEFAVRYGTPLIDTGCDVQVADDGTVTAGGQVRGVLTGANACLVCCPGFDPAQAAIDQMDRIARARHGAHGYVRGAEADATPSIANLNGLTAQFAVSQFLSLVNGDGFARWDYLHFDQFTGRTVPARTKRRDDCPLCGSEGYLLAGDPEDVRRSDARQLRRLEVQRERVL